MGLAWGPAGEGSSGGESECLVFQEQRDKRWESTCGLREAVSVGLEWAPGDSIFTVALARVEGRF